MAERLLELGAVLIGLAILARLALRVGLPTIPLYLIAGLAFGRGGVLPLVTTRGFIETGSEIGLILLLFMLGLEYSASELLDTMRRTSSAGVLDVTVNFVPGFVAGLLLGWGTVPAMFLGGVTLVSSSGIAAKMLEDLKGHGKPEARFVVSIAVIEDLAMAVYLPVLGFLAAGGITLGGTGAAALSVLAVVVFLLVAMRFEVGVSRVLFSHSDEALLLTILGVAILVAGLAEAIEVSAAVGALLAGIALSCPAAHGARQLLTPLRDLFAALFFAFIGLSVDPAAIPNVLVPAALLAVAGAGTKLLTGRFGGQLAGLGSGEGLRSGLLLIPRGEFSIAIAGLGVAAGVERKLAPLAVAYVLILATVGPVLSRVTLRPTNQTL
jgi:CPA2 family monovalent cation:H+ antiporter-2